ncbi:HIT family protein [Kutzneria sp. CA-103260]|uniref:HIT family protein n=1 Tax=Kutzneria sp. CA-103260 TaxID=2802641 RepID=UPI00211382E7|nr:HIT family protein [Kutzneria sp. CA-103260]
MFCAIVSGVAPASVVHEDEHLIAFCDLMPVNRGHLLIAPKRHATNLAELPEETGALMFPLAQRLAARIRRSLRPDGVNLVLADGRAAGQTVFHVHLHVIPRMLEDGFALHGGARAATRSDLDQVAELLRREL